MSDKEKCNQSKYCKKAILSICQYVMSYFYSRITLLALTDFASSFSNPIIYVKTHFYIGTFGMKKN